MSDSKSAKDAPKASHTMLTTQLLELTKGNKPKDMKRLIERGADPNADHEEDAPLGDELGVTRPAYFNTLQAAIVNQSIEALQILLENGADPNRETRNGDTPMYWGVEQGPKIFRMLLEHGGDVNYVPSSGISLYEHLHPCRFDEYHTETWELLIQAGAVRPAHIAQDTDEDSWYLDEATKQPSREDPFKVQRSSRVSRILSSTGVL